MATNYHTHTPRCHHAVGSEREYIEQAVREGMPVLGFSDHTPYPFDEGYDSNFRMRPEETEGYVQTLLELREAYRGRIEIKIGFEAEYYPAYFDRLLELLAPYPVDYLIMGQHFLENETSHLYSGEQTGSETRLARYVDQVIAGLETGKFSYLAHPDLVNFVGERAAYRRQCLRLCQAAKALAIPLEINLLGIREARAYPRWDFFAIAAEVGNDVILGSDAHAPDVVCDMPSREIARAKAKELGLCLIEEPVLRPPRL